MDSMKNYIDYFKVGDTPGGNQDWCTDFWMHLGGCGALAACDMAICLAKNKGQKDAVPYDPNHMTKQQYLDLSMRMKPYIHPRIGGVTKLSYFTEGFRKYMKNRGYQIEFDTISGKEDYEKAEIFVKGAIDQNLPVSYLMLRHRNPEFDDLNWHWFMITGYKTDRDGRTVLQYHTYGGVHYADFQRLWNTGMYRRGGMIRIRSVTSESILQSSEVRLP